MTKWSHPPGYTLQNLTKVHTQMVNIGVIYITLPVLYPTYYTVLYQYMYPNNCKSFDED